MIARTNHQHHAHTQVEGEGDEHEPVIGRQPVARDTGPGVDTEGDGDGRENREHRADRDNTR